MIQKVVWKIPHHFLYTVILLKRLKDVAEVDFLADDRVKILDLDTLLLHCVAVTNGYTTVV